MFFFVVCLLRTLFYKFNARPIKIILLTGIASWSWSTFAEMILTKSTGSNQRQITLIINAGLIILHKTAIKVCRHTIRLDSSPLFLSKKTPTENATRHGIDTLLFFSSNFRTAFFSDPSPSSDSPCRVCY